MKFYDDSGLNPEISSQVHSKFYETFQHTSIKEAEILLAGTEELEVNGSIVADTLDTGYGANELWDMNQHVLTTSNVTFNNVTVSECIVFSSGGIMCST